jgi:hypothetical protein
MTGRGEEANRPTRNQGHAWQRCQATEANTRGAMLAYIYNWFTEGFDTDAVKDAKALLDELKSPPDDRHRDADISEPSPASKTTSGLF